MRERAPLKPEAGKGEADKPPNVPSLLPPDMTASTHMVYQNVNIIHEEFMIEQFMKMCASDVESGYRSPVITFPV